jgi:hypothetical protein
LVLAQHGLADLAVLDVEENPGAQRAQEIGRLEKRLPRRASASCGASGVQPTAAAWRTIGNRTAAASVIFRFVTNASLLDGDMDKSSC